MLFSLTCKSFDVHIVDWSLIELALNSPRYDLGQTDRLTSWVSFTFTENIGVYISIYYHSSTDNPWATEEKQ